MTSDSASTYQWSLNGQVVRNDSNSQFNISYIDVSSTTQGGVHITVLSIQMIIV